MKDAVDQLLLAIQFNDVESVKSVAVPALSSGEKDILHYAAQLGNYNVVKAMLDSGWIKWIDEFDEMSCTPLMWAAKSNHPDVVRLLLAAGADVNAHDVKHIGNTVLREVVEFADPEMVQLLLEAGADPAISGWMQLNAIDKAEERLEKEASSTAKTIVRMLRPRNEPN